MLFGIQSNCRQWIWRPTSLLVSLPSLFQPVFQPLFQLSSSPLRLSSSSLPALFVSLPAHSSSLFQPLFQLSSSLLQEFQLLHLTSYSGCNLFPPFLQNSAKLSERRARSWNPRAGTQEAKLEAEKGENSPEQSVSRPRTHLFKSRAGRSLCRNCLISPFSQTLIRGVCLKICLVIFMMFIRGDQYLGVPGTVFLNRGSWYLRICGIYC